MDAARQAGLNAQAGVEGSDFGSRPSRGRWLGAGVALVALAYLPLLVNYGQGLWRRSHYQFFPAAILGAAFLARRQFGELKDDAVLQAVAPTPLKVLGGAAVLLFLGGTVWGSPWMGYASALLLGCWVTLVAGGTTLLRAMIPPLVMLLILITPPIYLDQEFARWLSEVAVRVSSRVLDGLGIPHLLAGKVIEIPGRRLLVEEACSGIISIYAVVALSLFYGLWKRRSWVHLVWVTAAAAGAVVLGNVVRITLGGVVAHRYGWDWLSGWRHEVLGLGLLLAYVVLIYSADLLVLWLREGFAAAQAPGLFWWERQAAIDRTWGRLRRSMPVSPLAGWMLVVMGAYVASGVYQGVQWWTRTQKPATRPERPVGSRLSTKPVFELPASVGDWRLLEAGAPQLQTIVEPHALYSMSWAYSKGQQVCLVGLGYPYGGFHDLSICYKASGWELREPTLTTGQAGGENTVIEIEMTRQPINRGHLFYSAFTEAGAWYSPNPARRFRDRFALGRYREEYPTTYQIQLLALGFRPDTETERQEALTLFLAVRDALRRQILTQLGRSQPLFTPRAP